jgi:hypothetical protein
MTRKERVENRTNDVLNRAKDIYVGIWKRQDAELKKEASKYSDLLHAQLIDLLVAAGFSSELKVRVTEEQTVVSVVDHEEGRTYDLRIGHRTGYDRGLKEITPVEKISVNWFGSSIEDTVAETTSVDYLLMIGLVSKEINKGGDLVQYFINAANDIGKLKRISDNTSWEVGTIQDELRKRKNTIEKEEMLSQFAEGGKGYTFDQIHWEISEGNSRRTRYTRTFNHAVITKTYPSGRLLVTAQMLVHGNDGNGDLKVSYRDEILKFKDMEELYAYVASAVKTNEKARKIVSMIEGGLINYKTKGYFHERLVGGGYLNAKSDETIQLSKPVKNEYDYTLVNIVGEEDGKKAKGQILLNSILGKIDIEK